MGEAMTLYDRAVERAARALCDDIAVGGPCEATENGCPVCGDAMRAISYHGNARAAILAFLEEIREPSPEMATAGLQVIRSGDKSASIDDVWQAMLDALLPPHPEGKT
jgi:hypothetical protein